MEKYAQVDAWVDILKNLPYPRSNEEVYAAIEQNGQMSIEDFQSECEAFYKLYLNMLEYAGSSGVGKKMTTMFNMVARILDLIGHQPQAGSEEQQESLFDALLSEGDEEIRILASVLFPTKYGVDKFVGGVQPIDPAISSPEEIAKQMGLITNRMLLVGPEERSILQQQLDSLNEYREKFLAENPQPQQPGGTPATPWSGAYTDWLGWGWAAHPKDGWEPLNKWQLEKGPKEITEYVSEKNKGVLPFQKDFVEPEKEPKWYEKQKQVVTKVPEGRSKITSGWTDFHDIGFLKPIMQEKGWWEYESEDVKYSEALIDLFDYPELGEDPYYFEEKFNMEEEEAIDLIEAVKLYYPDLFGEIRSASFITDDEIGYVERALEDTKRKMDHTNPDSPEYIDLEWKYQELQKVLTEEREQGLERSYAHKNIDDFLKVAEENLNINDISKDELNTGIDIEKEHKDTIEDIYRKLDNRQPTQEELTDAQTGIAVDHDQEANQYTGKPNYYKDYLVPMEQLMKKNISLREIADLDTLVKYSEEEKKEEEEKYKEDFTTDTTKGKNIDVKAVKNIDDLLTKLAEEK